MKTILLTLLLLVFTGSGFAQSDKQTITVTFWNWLPHMEQPFWDAAVEEYNKKHPGINIVIEWKTHDFMEIVGDFSTSLETRQHMPDVMSIEYFHWPEFLGNAFMNHLVDLTPLVERQRGNISEASMAEFSHNGKKFAVSYQAAPFVFAYREDLLRDNDINPPLETWTDFYSAANRLKAKGIDLAMFDLSGAQAFFSLFLQRGGKVFDENQNFVFPNYRDEAVSVLNFMVSLNNEGLISDSKIADFMNGLETRRFSQGEIAGLAAGDWILPRLKELHPELSGLWRVQPLPRWRDVGYDGVANGGTGFAVVRRADRSADELNIIADFLVESVYSLKNQALFFKSRSLQMTNLALFNNKSAILMRDPYFDDQQLALVLREAIKNSATRSIGAKYYEFNTRMNELIRDVMSGKTTAEQALETFSL